MNFKIEDLDLSEKSLKEFISDLEISDKISAVEDLPGDNLMFWYGDNALIGVLSKYDGDLVYNALPGMAVLNDVETRNPDLYSHISKSYEKINEYMNMHGIKIINNINKHVIKKQEDR